MQTEPADPLQKPAAIPLATRLVLLALFLFLLDPVLFFVTGLLLRSSDFFDWFYGPAQVNQPDDIMRTRIGLWIQAAAFPFWVACVALFFNRLKVVAPADVGLAPRNFAGEFVNLLIGLGSAVILTPLVLGLNFVVTWYFKDVLHFQVKDHPFTHAGQQGLFAVEWGLLALAAMVVAPLREELLFRGVLQRLFAEHPWGGHVGIGLAGVIAACNIQLPSAAARSRDALALASAVAPLLFVAAMTPFYLLICRRSKTKQPPAVFATALFFAAVHSSVWPSPIALLVLGLGLGYLSFWTRSLVAPIVVHSIFNGVSFALLLSGWGT
jgi:membrane protease YdiL (CAAX protease family)